MSNLINCFTRIRCGILNYCLKNIRCGVLNCQEEDQFYSLMYGENSRCMKCLRIDNNQVIFILQNEPYLHACSLDRTEHYQK